MEIIHRVLIPNEVEKYKCTEPIFSNGLQIIFLCNYSNTCNIWEHHGSYHWVIKQTIMLHEDSCIAPLKLKSN